MMRLIILAAFILCFNYSIGQEITTNVSAPVDVPKTGLDRILQVRNGNTMLFHFENKKGIIVKVFDSSRNEVASLKHLCKVVDINILDRSSIDGIYDIGGEAVMFITQDIDNRETVVRLRLSAETGKLIAEEKIIQSESFKKPTRARLLKNRGSDSYYFVCAKENEGFIDQQLFILKFNERHEKEKEIPVAIDQKGYDDVSFHSAEIDTRGGVMLFVVLRKIIQYPSLYDKFLALAYLHPEAGNVLYKKVQLPSSAYSFATTLTHNQFANSLNILLSLYSLGEILDGNTKKAISYTDRLMLITNEDLSGFKTVPIENTKIKENAFNLIDTNQYFTGTLADMHTNQYGLTTVVYSGAIQNKHTFGLPHVKGVKTNVSFTQLNDLGEELFGTSLPVCRLKSYDEYPSVFHANNEDGKVRPQCFHSKYSFYVAYNETPNNFDVKLANMPDSIYNCEYTNAVYYKLSRKKEVSKGYLFGKPIAGEHKVMYAGSGDFDERTNTFATAYLHKKGKSYTTHIAWIKFKD